jgi:hypothetical protein
MNQRKKVAPQARSLRHHDANYRLGRDGSIDGVTTKSKNISAGFGREGMRR